MADAPDQFDRALIEAFKRLGMSESSAAVAARGRPGSGTYERDDLPLFDNRVDRYRRSGMSESAAKRAAIGREYRSEAEARQAMGEDPSGSRALSEAEHEQIVNSRQWRRYMALREGGMAPYDAASQALDEEIHARYREGLAAVRKHQESSRTRLQESTDHPIEHAAIAECSCGAAYVAADAPCPACRTREQFRSRKRPAKG